MLSNVFSAHSNDRYNEIQSKQSGLGGRYFLLGFMQNEIYLAPGGVALNLFISSHKNATVSIASPYGTARTTIKIPADSVIQFPLYFPSIEMIRSEIALRQAVEIISDEPITVSGLSSQSLTTDGYSAIPVHKWGLEYIVHSWPNDIYMTPHPIDAKVPRTSEFMIIASEDQTTIEFAPKSATWNGIGKDISTYILLNKGDCYLVKSDTLPKGQGDLSGTIIRSDKPIGVFGGHVRTAIPIGLNDFDSKNHLIEMLQPTSIWGKQYPTMPFKNGSNGDFFRIMCLQSNTTVQAKGSGGTNSYTLNNPGDFTTLNFIREPLFIQADKPISVAQYMSTSYSSDPNSQTYDPCMIILPSLESFVKEALFHVMYNPPTNPNQFNRHFINVICSEDAVDYIMLDNNYISSITTELKQQRISGTTLFYVALPVSPGTHKLSSSEGNFACSLYGLGSDDAYGYPLGFALSKGIDTLSPRINIKEECGKLQGEIEEVLLNDYSGLYDINIIEDSSYNYNWNISRIFDNSMSGSFTANPIDAKRNAKITLEAIDNAGNKTIYVHTYSALSLIMSDTIQFKEIASGDSICIDYTIKNFGLDTVCFLQASMMGDNRLSFVEKGLPLFDECIAPGNTRTITICFKANPDTSDVSAFLYLETQCKTMITVPIKGSIYKQSLLIEGHDFGKVSVKDSSRKGNITIINTGKKSVQLLQLNYTQKSNGTFVIDTSTIFPFSLTPKDSLILPCHFYPSDTVNYQESVTVINTQNIDNQAFVLGKGITPRITGIIYDWNKKRTQTVHNTSMSIYNTGSDTAILSIDSSGFDQNIFHVELPNNVPSINVNPYDSILISLTFTPLDTIAYSGFGAIQFTNGFVTGKQTIELHGIGTQPFIRVHDTYLGTIVEGQTKDSNCVLFKTYGNESLSVDSIIIVSGDISSFSIDPTYLKNQIINYGTAYSIPIAFNPKRIGKHSVKLAIYHDALPAYKKTMSIVEIWGNAVSIDTIKVDISNTGSVRTRVCTERVIGITIMNKGNRDVYVKSIDFQSLKDSISVIKRVNQQFPLTIPANNGFLTYFFNVTFTKIGSDIIQFTAIVNDSIQLKTNVSLLSIENKISFTNKSIQPISYFPGEQMKLSITGSYDAPVTSSVQFKPKLLLEYPAKAVTCINKSSILYFNGISGEIKLPADIIPVSQSTVLIESGTELILDGSGTWHTELDFDTYLTDSVGTITIRLINPSNDCFTVDTTSYPIMMEKVCAYDMRIIGAANSGFGLLGVGPHPLDYNSTVSFLLSKECEYSIQLLDILGNEKMHYSAKGSKGLHQVQIDKSSLLPGSYILIFQALGKSFTQSLINFD